MLLSQPRTERRFLVTYTEANEMAESLAHCITRRLRCPGKWKDGRRITGNVDLIAALDVAAQQQPTMKRKQWREAK